MSSIFSIILPTRGRPKLFKEMHDSALATASKPENIEVCIYVDEDDDSILTLIVQREIKQAKIDPAIGSAQSGNVTLKTSRERSRIAENRIPIIPATKPKITNSGIDSRVKVKLATNVNKGLIPINNVKTMYEVRAAMTVGTK